MSEKFNSDGVEIAYQQWGEGQPILLIHGFASNMNVNWRDTGWVATLNKAGYRVIAIDNRGHGESEKLYDKALYLAPMMAEDARRLLDHLNIERAAVMGYSMGARISAFLTLHHPARVRCVVFGGMASNLVNGVGGTEAIAQALLAPTLSDVTDREARGFRIFADSTKADKQALAACILSSRVKLKAEALAAIQCPALFVAGELDEVAGSIDGIVAMLLHARGVTLPRRNHMNAVGDSGYKQAVLAFLNDVELGKFI